MIRQKFSSSGVKLSYLDFGGGGDAVIALHAFWMEAGTYESLALALSPQWRLIALDQRGHGESGRPDDLSWDACIADLEALVRHLGIAAPVTLIGNSLGGTVAFRYAARHPDAVKAMVLEESPAIEDGDLSFMRAWEGIYPTREALLEKIGERLAWSVEPSIRQVEGGWTLSFSANKMADAAQKLHGDFWLDWLATDCPALVIRGKDSKAVDGELLAEMAERRANTRLATLPGGHVVHHDAPEEFEREVRSFLLGLDK